MMIHHISKTIRRLGLAVLLTGAATAPTLAQEAPRVVPVHFAQGASSVSLKGRVKGHESVDYKLHAKAGQTLLVNLKASNSSTYFNVIEPGAAHEAMFNSSGSAEGNNFSGELKQSGEYTVRVYQMRNAARRGNATTTLKLSIH